MKSTKDKYKKQDRWIKRGKFFAVEIVRTDGFEEGKNNWCVYAYVYPNHPIFNKLPLGTTSLLNGVAGVLTEFEDLFHWGITYNELKYETNKYYDNIFTGKFIKIKRIISFWNWFLFSPKTIITCQKIGADYMHANDNYFSKYDTLEDACEIKNDAENLFNYLESIKE